MLAGCSSSRSLLSVGDAHIRAHHLLFSLRPHLGPPAWFLTLLLHHVPLGPVRSHSMPFPLLPPNPNLILSPGPIPYPFLLPIKFFLQRFYGWLFPNVKDSRKTSPPPTILPRQCRDPSPASLGSTRVPSNVAVTNTCVCRARAMELACAEMCWECKHTVNLKHLF